MNGVTCRTCGLVNPPARTFCQRCGAQLDPAVGTMAGTPRPADGAPVAPTTGGGGGRRLALAGIGLVIIAAVVGAALVFGGVLGGPGPTPSGSTVTGSPSPGHTTEPSRTQPPATSAAATDGPDEPTDAPVTDPPPTAVPDPTATPRVTPRPTRTPRPTGVAAVVPPPTDWVCDGGSTTIDDPLSPGWNLRRVDWSGRGDYDRLLVTLDRRPALAGDATHAIVHVRPTNEIASSLKVVPPSRGRTSIALGLWQGVRLTWAVDQAVGLPAIDWVTLGTDDNDFAWLVVGTGATDPCYSLQVPAWTADAPAATDTIQVALDIQH